MDLSRVVLEETLIPGTHDVARKVRVDEEVGAFVVIDRDQEETAAQEPYELVSMGTRQKVLIIPDYCPPSASSSLSPAAAATPLPDSLPVTRPNPTSSQTSPGVPVGSGLRSLPASSPPSVLPLSSPADRGSTTPASPMSTPHSSTAVPEASALSTSQLRTDTVPAQLDDPFAYSPLKDRLVSEEPALVARGARTLDHLRSHADVTTVGDLAAFPLRWPGMYAMLKECGIADDLDALVSAAAAVLLDGKAPSPQPVVKDEILATEVAALAASRLERSLMQSWLAPRLLKTTRTAERTRALLSLLKKAPSNGILPGPDASVSVLACVDGKDLKLLSGLGVRSLQELALFGEGRPELYARASAQVPLLDNMAVHAKALLA